MTSQAKFPFSTDELRNELKHTMWLLNRVDNAKALTQKLEKLPVFKDYKVVLAAGDGRLGEEEGKSKMIAVERYLTDALMNILKN